VLVPAVKEMVKRVDIAAGVVVMDPVPGIFDDAFEVAE
jgi:ribosomal 30S subunit maturation factor RimM